MKWSPVLSEFVYHGEILTTEATEDVVNLKIRIPENLFYFQGHFPDIAILPGVVMTNWALEYAEQFFQYDPTRFIGLNTLKFMLIVRPNYELKFTMSKLSDSRCAFSYISSHGKHCSGKVLYK